MGKYCRETSCTSCTIVTEVINKIRNFRHENNVPVYFTLDAGPNVHILYPHNVKDMVTHFIEEELVYLCENSRVIHDNVGKGPIKTS